MYAYLVEKAEDRSGRHRRAGGRDHAGTLAGATTDRGTTSGHDLSTASRVNYTWFTQHVVPDAWNRGRVVLIGEAAHSAPPTLAQGAAQALEDAAVLAELLLDRDAVDQDLWDAFHARRLPRATEVVEASVQLGTWLLEEKRDANIPGLMGRIGASGERAGMSIVDVHAHVLLPAAAGRDAGSATRPASPRPASSRPGATAPESLAASGAMIGERFARLTQLPLRLADMDAQGVDVQLVSPSPSHYYPWAGAGARRTGRSRGLAG